MNGIKTFFIKKNCGTCNKVPLILLTLVIIVGLVLLFKDPITAMLQSVLGKK